MKGYEMVLVYGGEPSQEEMSRVGASITAILSRQGAVEVEVKDLGQARLAYPVEVKATRRLVSSGHFLKYNFSAEPSAIRAIREEVARMDVEPVRFLIALREGAGMDSLSF